VILLAHDNGIINISFLGGYWKLPLLSLTHEGTMTEKHKSKIDPARISSAKINPDDQKKVEDILRSIMPKIYRKMLQDKKERFEQII
ncbi:MAG: hypothetical protein V1855_04670, partial [bacterium]